MTVRLSKIEVKGDLLEILVRTAVMKEMEAVNRCVKQKEMKTSSLKGEGLFTLLVGHDGRVKEGRVEKGTTIAEDLSRCILEILKAIRFHADSGRQDVSLKFTFTLG